MPYILCHPVDGIKAFDEGMITFTFPVDILLTNKGVCNCAVYHIGLVFVLHTL